MSQVPSMVTQSSLEVWMYPNSDDELLTNEMVLERAFYVGMCGSKGCWGGIYRVTGGPQKESEQGFGNGVNGIHGGIKSEVLEMELMQFIEK